jgi:hypothetical protein
VANLPAVSLDPDQSLIPCQHAIIEAERPPRMVRRNSETDYRKQTMTQINALQRFWV